MGLTNKREEIVKKMPTIETRFEKSKDGLYLIHRTIISTIRPLAYFEKVLAGDVEDEDDSQAKVVQASELEG